MRVSLPSRVCYKIELTDPLEAKSVVDMLAEAFGLERDVRDPDYMFKTKED